MKNKDYWQKRMLAYEEAQRNKGLDYLTNLNEQYTMLTSELEKELARWYSRFAKNNEISMVEAKKLLNSQELKEFKWSVKDYIDYGRMNAVDQMWMKQLENASAKVHISRLESIKLQMQQHVEVLYNNQLDDLDGILRDIYQEGYYRTAWEIQRGLNVGYTMQSINENQLDKILSRPWSYDNKTFSSRIWTHKKQLINELETHLVQSVTMGKKPDEAIKKIARFTGTYDKKPRAALYRAGRLVMTESAAFSSMAQEDCFNELGVEKYEIIATLDSHTSKICRGLDKRTFDMKDYKVGQTAPPFHSFCRTVTAPYFDDEFSIGKRAARGVDGETYYVASDMKYGEWYNEYVESTEIQKAKEEIKELGIKGKVSIPAKTIDTSILSFDNKHINTERNHNVTRDEAISYIINSKISISRWNDRFLNFYSILGVAYVDVEKNEIRTAFKPEEFGNDVKGIIEVMKNYGK